MTAPDRITEAPAAFLRWLVEERGYTALDICDVAERPWKWSPEYREWHLEREQQTRVDVSK